MISLRDHQEESIHQVRGSLKRQIEEGQRPSVILESPTGSGKTVMAAFIAQSTVEKGGTVAFICHRKELIDQTAKTFNDVGLDYGFIASGMPLKAGPIQICSIGTLVNRVHAIKAPTVVIWDECHHVGAKTWSHIRHEWEDSIHIGLTATPARLDGKGLGRWFNDLIAGPKVRDLMAAGHLSTYDAYAPVVPDVSRIPKQGGEFAKGKLESVLDSGEILGGIVEHWKKLSPGKKTVGFAVTVAHSQHIVEAFRAAGVKAAHLDAKTAKSQRRLMLQDFAKGNVDVLFNVDLFGEGFDLAANSGMDVTIESCILARTTASIGLHLQQVGRALRAKDYPAIILDHAGNLLRHGLPDDERTWTLADQAINETENSPKQCPSCYAVVPRHLRACQMCGYIFPETEAKEVTEVEGELEKIVSGAETAEQLQMDLRRRRKEVASAETLAALKKIEAARGLSDGWAERIISSRRGAAPARRF